ncbi:MAG: phage integrase N-terminal SAM-like domain-containing protein [Bacteroidales bacterium]|nr:phage integrase N-terminal SAM-like domain-containing protein [Bacteroidales bacterium]
MNDFIKYLQKKGLTQTTQQAYLFNTNKFLNWYSGELINTEKKDILKYLEYLKKNKKQQNVTRRNSLISLNHYFEFLRENEQISENPTNLLKIRGTKKKQLYNIFTAEELTQLADDYYNIFIKTFDENHIPKNQRQNSYLTRNRNYLMLTFLVYQGLHTNELQRISLDDIDPIKASVNIQGSKKTNERKLILRPEQIGFLMHYLQNIRPQFLEKYNIENNNLFLSLPEVSKKNTEQTRVMYALKTLTTQTKSINPNFTSFKQVRASIITNWIKTAGLRKAQYFAGHRYISTTEDYLPNDLEQLTDEIEKFNPFTF